MFIIINNTAGTVGPYGIPATSIATGNTFTVNPPVISYVCDPNLLADIMLQNVSIQIGNLVLPWDIAIAYMNDLDNNGRAIYRNLTGNATTTVKSGSGVLIGIILGDNSTGGTVKIYDNTAGSGTAITTMQVGSPSGGLLSSSGQPGAVFVGPLNIEFSTGLTIVTSGSSSNNVTILYK